MFTVFSFLLSWVSPLVPLLSTTWLVVIMTSILIGAIFPLTYSILSRLKILKLDNLQLPQYVLISLLIFFTSTFTIHFYLATNVKGVKTSTNIDTSLRSSDKSNISPSTIPVDCNFWISCTDFKTDQNLENKYYRHVQEEPQKIILEGGPFASPPLYLSEIFSPFFKLKLDVQPLDLNAANIIVEAKEMFQIFIGDNDYRSFAFLYWNPLIGEWERKDDSKIYLLNNRDIDPRTQLSIEIETWRKDGNAEVNFLIIYKNIKGDNDKHSFKRAVKIPSSKPEDFITKIGVALYRVKGNIPQAKFFFLGVKQK